MARALLVSWSNAWKSQWLHSIVFDWRKWFKNQSRARHQAEKLKFGQVVGRVFAVHA